MSARLRFWLAVAALGLLMTGPFLVTVAIVAADLGPVERAMLVEVLGPRLPIGTLMTLLGFILGVHILRLLFRQYVQGLLQMAENLRLMLGANRNFRVVLDGPPEVRELARAANDLAQQRDELLVDVEARIARAMASVEEERNRLAALMSELTTGVVVCNLDGRILLYNNRVRRYLMARNGSGSAIGLGRSIFAMADRGQITHALDNIRRRLAKGNAEPTAHFIAATSSGQLLRVHMAPVLVGGEPAAERQITGYVLSIENITLSFEREARRDQALNTLTDGNRAALGAMRAAVETLMDNPEMEAELRDRFIRVVGDEATRMSQHLEETVSGFADTLKTRWPLEDMLGSDLIAAAQRRIEDKVGVLTKSEEIDESLWLRTDSFSLIQGMTFLAARLVEHYAIREVRFRLGAEGRMAFLDLIWSGATVSSETLYTWELEPMSIGAETSPLTLRDIMDRHGGEIWYQREKAAHRAFYRIVLPLAAQPEDQGEEARPRGRDDGSRPEYYDFDLFSQRDASIDLDRKLTELAYTVFDTETTGLEPSGGDEIIQVGAVRIINGRLLRQEVFDQLVDPGRPIKPEGIPIHGITEEMVRGQPAIDVVLPAFHEFCSETVLVAHNAAFDMRFLQLKEAATEVSFTQPVLDTLLLSVVIHPHQESHRIESIAERLGIDVIGRHTALGDAFVTGEIFLKMLPLLAEQGIVTLRQALEAAEKTYYARVRY